MQSVAYLGPESTYSHQITLQKFPQETYTHVPCITITDIFHSVQSGKTTFGVVPFENSTNGGVVFSLDLFCDRENEFSSIKVLAEAYLSVHHCLLGHPRRGGGVISPDTVSKIYSHPQAFGQCEAFLTEFLKGVDRVDVSSTSKAADLANEDPRAVAIASAVAVSVHPNLQILKANIEERDDNATRFLVISSSASSLETTKVSPVESDDKTFMTFTVDHKLPGALCDVLRVFKDFGLNLTSIASRPSKSIPWNYIFLVEFEGHEELSSVKRALARMQKYCGSLRVFGSYKNEQPRREVVGAAAK